MLTPLQHTITKHTKLKAIQARHCSKYCKGPQNTSGGMIAKALTLDPLPKLAPGGKGYPCPHGCKQNPTTPEIAINIIKNSGFNSICLRNPWRYLKTL